MDEYLNKLQIKYGYSQELIEALETILPAFIEYYGKENEDMILEAIENCEIHMQEEKEDPTKYNKEYFDQKEVGNYSIMAVASYDSMPIVDGDKITAKRLVYLLKSDWKDEKNLSRFVHELGHLVKSYKNEYAIVDGKIKQRSGLIKNDVEIDEKTGKYVEKNVENTGIEEAINCYDEEQIMSKILGREYITGLYFGRYHEVTTRLLKDEKLRKAIRDSQLQGTDEFEKVMGKELTKELMDEFEEYHYRMNSPIGARNKYGRRISDLVDEAEENVMDKIKEYEYQKMFKKTYDETSSKEHSETVEEIKKVFKENDKEINNEGKEESTI